MRKFRPHPTPNTHTGRREHFLLLYSILNRCQYGRDRSNAGRSSYVDQSECDRLMTLRTVQAILPDTWTRQPKLTWSAHLPTSEWEGVTYIMRGRAARSTREQSETVRRAPRGARHSAASAVRISTSTGISSTVTVSIPVSQHANTYACQHPH